MPVYRYTAAKSDQGSTLMTRGELTADTDVQVRQALRRAGLTPVRVAPSAPERSRWTFKRHHASGQDQRDSAESPESHAAWSSAPARRRSRRRTGALVEFYESLAALLASGLPLASALETIARAQTTARNASLGTLCRELAEGLAQGDSLAGAMFVHEDWFKEVDRALVRAAEESGELERALSDLAEHHARGEELRGKLAAALSYPALLCLFGIAVVIFLSTTTLPPLVATLTDAGVEPPGATRALMAVGGLFTDFWWLIAGVGLGAALVVHRGLRASPLGPDNRGGGIRGAVSARLLRAPLLGAALARAELGSACVMLARLLDGGVTLADALALTIPTVRNRTLRTAFDGLRSRLIEGRSFRAELDAEGPSGRSRATATAELPEDIVRVLEVGRESGELPRALRTLGERRLRSARRLIDRLAAVLEPVVILLLAALIGLVVYAAIAPMLRLAQTL
ncbi:MAG: type II secretion system F family protein [Phycisphaerales bacterium]|nr:type II secretion system F family protein [Phycisphaerales bacterium]